MENQLGYIRFYMGQKELEEFISTQIEEKYKDKPIKLTDVIFDKEGGSVDFHFITITPNEEKEKSHWDCERTKINPLDVCDVK